MIPNANEIIAKMKAANKRRMVRQPLGTNHFQFRDHQLRLGSGGVFGSMAPFYFNRRALYNSLRRDLRLNDSLQSDTMVA
jgi:hypothetical protein